MTRESPVRLRNRPATEAAIVDAAEGLLLAHGWTALNIQTLAAAAGVDRKLVYRYFDGVDGVMARIAARMDVWLARTLAAEPPSDATAYRQFARESLLAWLRALRSNPLILRLLAWELTEDSPALRAAEASRAAVFQAWMRARRPRLRVPPAGDLVALNAVLLASVQHLALAAPRRDFGGVTLDDAGWARIEAAIDTLTGVWPD